jgi:hypothetical protein
MPKLRDYYLWEEDEYNPFAEDIQDTRNRGKKKKNGNVERYEKEEDY